MGRCTRCTYGEDYTAYPSGIDHCVSCDRCSFDKELVKPCTRTSNTVCRCKRGRFCPNGSCEVCLTCKRCPGRVKLECNDTSDTICEDILPDTTQNPAVSFTAPPTKDTDTTWIIYPCLGIVVAFVIGVGIFVCCKKKVCQPGAKKILDSGTTSLTDVSVDGRTSTPLQQKKTGEGNRSFSEEVVSTDVERESLLQASKADTSASSKSERLGFPPGQSLSTEGEDAEAPSHDSTSNHPSQQSLGTGTSSNCCGGENPRETNDQNAQAASASESDDQRKLTAEDWTRCFHCFIRNVPKKNWNSFMRTLHPNERIIEVCDHDYPSNVEERNYQMLRQWREEVACKASIKVLLDSLHKIHLNACRENVINELRLEKIPIS
ncbi:tumor necrosis factor receptor superfamily member 10B-like [Spea bombifrons]|uniref:tumor necrosis factor receptor superfamily member 10B-like n=1 Tax=Spea bombifrons TaxID=233779 RepID=UPI002349FE70|nr:tumor necrosis factor receptor superfamily member 10B-like [Spea bombifrons]